LNNTLQLCLNTFKSDEQKVPIKLEKIGPSYKRADEVAYIYFLVKTSRLAIVVLGRQVKVCNVEEYLLILDQC